MNNYLQKKQKLTEEYKALNKEREATYHDVDSRVKTNRDNDTLLHKELVEEFCKKFNITGNEYKNRNGSSIDTIINTPKKEKEAEDIFKSFMNKKYILYYKDIYQLAMEHDNSNNSFRLAYKQLYFEDLVSILEKENNE